jgi:hypothetical protein
MQWTFPVETRAINVPTEPPMPQLPENWPKPPPLPEEEPPPDPSKPPKHDPEPQEPITDPPDPEDPGRIEAMIGSRARVHGRR